MQRVHNPHYELPATDDGYTYGRKSVREWYQLGSATIFHSYYVFKQILGINMSNKGSGDSVCLRKYNQADHSF